VNKTDFRNSNVVAISARAIYDMDIYVGADQDYLDVFGGDDNTLATVKKAITKVKKTTFSCAHERVFEEDGVSLCQDCGFETNVLSFTPEWHYYGSSDNRNTKDPSRCHKAKGSTKGGIDKVFQDAKLELPEAIKQETAVRYQKIVNGETMRGKGRKAVVAACLFYVLRNRGDNRTSDEVGRMFGLKKSAMSNGLNEYHSVFAEDRISQLKPSDLVRRIMFLTGVGIEHYATIVKLSKLLENTSMLLNHSNVQSVASATVYLYLCVHPKLKEKLGLTKAKFAEKAGLSDITITKLVKEEVSVLKLAVQV